MTKREVLYHSRNKFTVPYNGMMNNPYTNITIEDIRNLKKELDKAEINHRYDGDIIVNSISETHYEIKSNYIHMVVRKDLWEDALKKQGYIQ